MLPKKYRLTKNGSFAYLYAKGNRVPAKYVKLNYVRSRTGVKIGFSVSNKIGDAVTRNKVKRRMRAIAYEVIRDLMPCQAVFVTGVGVDKLSYDELKSTMMKLIRGSGLLK